MTNRTVRWAVFAACVAGFGLVGAAGCAVSRHGELKAMSRRVETRLRDEQRIALDADAALDRQAKLDHLTTLRFSLSAANVALGAVPRVVPEPERPLAYDVLEEVYATIDWNVPLMPGQGLRPLPDAFAGGVLNLNAARPPVTGGIVPGVMQP